MQDVSNSKKIIHTRLKHRVASFLKATFLKKNDLMILTPIKKPC